MHLFRLLAALLLFIAAPLPAQPWLNAGSDIPPEAGWLNGTLPNGVRYAVRRNPLPAGSVSIRLRIAAGGLMERPDERGYAHFLEHMLFRGTAGVPDGEGIRIWQRLGASFGQDTNAFTTPTQTFYALDLPRNDAASLDTAMATLSAMMTDATIEPALVEVERKVVMAERALRQPPLAKTIQDAARPLFYAGLAYAQVEVAGSDETLAAATPARLRAFYRRWYRPERATIIVVGDADPADLQRLVERHLGSWRGEGPPPAEPDSGRPVEPAANAALVVEPEASNTMTLVWPRPHDDRPFTAKRAGDDMVQTIAARIVSRRLTRIARDGGPFTSGSLAATEARGIMDQTTLTLAHRQSQWRQALERGFAVLAGVVAEPPSQAEVDRELAVFAEALDAQVAGWPTIRSPNLAGGLLGAIDQGRVSAAPETMRDIFAALRPSLDRDTLGAAMRALTVGEPRLLMTSPVPVPGGERGLAAALTAAKAAKAEARAEQKAVRFADLGTPAAPGTVVARTELADLGITRVRFGNGVELVVKPTPFETDRVLLSVSFGHGLAGLPPDLIQPIWTVGAVQQGGVGPFDVDAVERLIAGRRISLGLGVDERSFDVAGATNARDLADALRLAGTWIAEPRLDRGALARLKSQLAGSYDSIFAAPGSVYGVFGQRPLHGGDLRWAYPTKAQLLLLTPEDYAGFWAPLFAQGPRRVVIVGDVTVEQAVAAVAASIGAAETRPAPPPRDRRLDVRPPRAGDAVRLAHRGDQSQALVALAWPTSGLLRDVAGGRALNVAAAVMQARLFDRFRESEGGTYSPSVFSAQSQTFPRYGFFAAVAQVRTERQDDFLRAAREIAGDLARAGPTGDELARAVQPIVSGNTRAERTNAFWASALERDLDDPRVLAQLRTNVSGYQQIDARAVRRAAAKWLRKAPATVIVAREAPAAMTATP